MIISVVTTIRLLPWDISILISAGGDNTIRTWDFVKGKEIQSLNYLEHINKYIPEVSLIVCINIDIKMYQKCTVNIHSFIYYFLHLHLTSIHVGYR